MYIMVVLRNILKDSIRQIIEANYYPDGGEEFGHIVVDLSTGEIVYVTEKDGAPWRRSAVGHARSELMKMASLDTMPEKRTVCWY